jgi:uncharacterized membrane protein
MRASYTAIWQDGAMPVSAPQGAPARARLDSIDLLRGAVMILMALDHSRDFFTSTKPNPTDLASTTPILFATRWVTHFCAPVFSFLAGTAAFLSASRGKPKRSLAWFLFTRGLWLIVLGQTVVHFAFFGTTPAIGGATLWALGAAMIALAPMVFLPTWAIGAIAVAIVAGHNLTDGIRGGIWWKVLHTGGPIGTIFGVPVFVGYPILPWIGVMAGGYAFGEVMLLPVEKRRRLLVSLGAGMLVLFAILRGANLYGDPHPWRSQPRGALFSFLSVLNCEKYPPSLSFLLMTMGPALLALRFLDGVRVSPDNFVVVFGRVPLFYYVLHLYALHIPAWLWFSRRYGASVLSINFFHAPADYGEPLVVAYIAWALAVVALYPLCRWYASLKARSRNPLLSYL